MGSSKKWDVWSIDRAKDSGLVVVEGVTEREATNAAVRRNASAQRLDMASTVFVALPQGQQPTAADLPPLPGPPSARNEHPLHTHADENEPWTQDTLSAHLNSLHGVDDESVLRSGLSALTIAHHGLNHGTEPQLRADWGLAPADNGYLGILTAWPHADRYTGDGQKFSWSCSHVHGDRGEATACARAELDRRNGKTALIDVIGAEPSVRTRQEAMELAPCEHHPGEHQLMLWGRTLGTQVCLTGTDRAHLAALLLPSDPDLPALQSTWSAKLGPGGRTAVTAGHAAGYRLGVHDMKHMHGELTEAERVQDFLAGFADAHSPALAATPQDVLSEADKAALDRVRELITMRGRS